MRDRLVELLWNAQEEYYDPCKSEIADYLLANGVIVPPFDMEEMGLIPNDRKFRWNMLDYPTEKGGEQR